MRPIKYRLWNNAGESSRMFYDTEQVMECLKQQVLFYDTNHRFNKLGYDHVGDGSSFMQFTGLQDKNKKDIYKGDIVNFAVKRKICPDCAKKECSSELKYGVSKFCPECGKVLTDSDFITTSEVVFDKGGFAYKWSSKESYYQSWQTHVAEIYLEWVEIIGNIYENPELITK